MNKNSKDSEKEELLDGGARTISSGSSSENSELIKGVFKEWRKRGFTVNPFDDQIILITSEIKDKLHQQKIKDIRLSLKDMRKNRKECLRRHRGNELAIQFDKGELFMLDIVENLLKDDE